MDLFQVFVEACDLEREDLSLQSNYFIDCAAANDYFIICFFNPDSLVIKMPENGVFIFRAMAGMIVKTACVTCLFLHWCVFTAAPLVSSGPTGSPPHPLHGLQACFPS